jgi:hypothetical protein
MVWKEAPPELSAKQRQKSMQRFSRRLACVADDGCRKQSAFGIIAGQEFDCAEPIIFLVPVHTFNSLNLHFPEFLADICDERDSRSAQIRRSSRLHRTTDYATVLFPLPGLSNDLEVVRLL